MKESENNTPPPPEEPDIPDAQSLTKLNLSVVTGLSFKSIRANVTNIGNNSANNLNLNLSIRFVFDRFRFFEISEKRNMSLDTLKSNISHVFEIDDLRGFGRIIVTAKASADNAKNVEKTVKGRIFLGFIFLHEKSFLSFY